MPSLAEQLSQVAYKRSPDVNDPKNQNADWRAGYAVGYGEDIESMTAIAREWEDRGRPNGKTCQCFIEWKIGFWAGRFTRIDEQRAAKANEP